jgi:predicted enzyme related to lactoylglutathione lyase
MQHLINWIEIPARDLARAKTFYSHILQVELRDMQIGDVRYAIFAVDDRFNCGALVAGGSQNPTEDGTVVYLDGGRDLAKVLSRVKKAGGKVVLEKTFIATEAGYVGLFIDTEGNKVGVHSMT